MFSLDKIEISKGSFANSEGPDECHRMWHFLRVLHYLIRQSISSEKKYNFLFGNYNR